MENAIVIILGTMVYYWFLTNKIQPFILKWLEPHKTIKFEVVFEPTEANPYKINQWTSLWGINFREIRLTNVGTLEIAKNRVKEFMDAVEKFNNFKDEIKKPYSLKLNLNFVDSFLLHKDGKLINRYNTFEEMKEKYDECIEIEGKLNV